MPDEDEELRQAMEMSKTTAAQDRAQEAKKETKDEKKEEKKEDKKEEGKGEKSEIQDMDISNLPSTAFANIIEALPGVDPSDPAVQVRTTTIS